VSLIYVTQYFLCDLVPARIFAPNITKNIHNFGHTFGLKRLIVLVVINLHNCAAILFISCFSIRLPSICSMISYVKTCIKYIFKGLSLNVNECRLFQ
jgi:hypothetical protein